MAHPNEWKQNRVKVIDDSVDENGKTFNLRSGDAVPRHVIITNKKTPQADPANDIMLLISYDGTTEYDSLGPRQSREIPGGVCADVKLVSSDNSVECTCAIVYTF